MKEAIAGREYSKFIFTRYISLALDLIQNVGQTYGFTAEDMAHVPTSFFEELRNGLYSTKDIKTLLKFFIPKTRPNFIGTKCIEAELIHLKNSKEMDGNRLKNCIILIEKADPGFDWIFNMVLRDSSRLMGGPIPIWPFVPLNLIYPQVLV